ncbi:uncharacterized protein LOC117588144 [Drosophila guanche]|uniref:uncharacterized protein LOC117588144 n=1 Tax=Drosophila guanche TaxID=7266 RepID=UPI0014721DC7|nr:uncharacterized protein LOC117588144 [Drosophila guanche]
MSQISQYVEDHQENVHVDAWDLEEKEAEELEKVKGEFLTYEDAGLGSTTVEEHRIQLVEGAEPFKDRHFPQSPAMQEVVWTEVDKMLELGVIERAIYSEAFRKLFVCELKAAINKSQSKIKRTREWTWKRRPPVKRNR